MYRFSFIIFLFLVSSANAQTNLTLEQKIGQLLMVHFKGELANEEAKELIEKSHIGSFIFYSWANGLSSHKQVHTLCSTLQALNTQYAPEIPLLFSVDQEGGRVIRLSQGFTQFPSSTQIAETGNPQFAFLAALITGQELKEAGIHINLAPVLDICSIPNSAIGDRSFGSDPSLVIDFGLFSLQGYDAAKVLAVAKHFPGYGGISVDPHEGLPILNKSRNQLDEEELLPFHTLLPHIKAIMTAHLLIPSLDTAPATTSYSILTKLLREEWGYQGLIISDSMVMKGTLQNSSSIEEMCVQALQAGCDILCLGGKLLNLQTQDELKPKDIIHIHHYLVDAVKTGRLSEDKISQSVERVLRVKQNYCIPRSDSPLSLAPEYILSQIDLFRRIHNLSSCDLEMIANKIWHNETKSRDDLLLFWNPRESFLSLGIGHFIWYPAGQESLFEEGFPAFITFMHKNHYPIPQWIQDAQFCPWKTREEWIENKTSSKQQELYQWIRDTKPYQAQFMIQRLEHVLFTLFQKAPLALQQKILDHVRSLTQTSHGLYVLTDYLNFKGSGLHSSEQYHNQGWGLFHVLSEMSEDETIPIESRFARAAAKLLTDRVKNAPTEKQEQKFLQGWLSRLQTYSTSTL